MPRGRPKGIKNKNTKSAPEIKVESASETDKVKEPEIVKTYKMSSFCDLCGNEIFCQPNVINLSILIGRSSWHRNCNKDKISICDACSKEINDVIEKFILKKNKSLARFDIQDKKEEIEQNS